MDFTPLPSELEELILCSCCHLPFNETDALPKLFSCRHYFCLKCVNQVLLKGNELYCVHCWKRTELTGPDMKPDALPTHNAILYLSQNLSMISSGSITSTNKKPPDKSNNGADSCGTVATTSSTTNGGSLSVVPVSTASGGASGNGASGSGISVVVGGGGGSGGSNTSSSSVGSGISVVVTTGSSVGSSVASNGSTGMPTNGAGVIGSAVVGGGIGIGVGGGAGGSAGTSGSGIVSAIGSGKYRSKGENCLTHAMPNALWCLKCSTAVCRACASGDEHRQHPVKTQAEARDHIRTDIASDLLLMQKSLAELQHFVFKQRDFLLKILEACTALKTQVETELINHLPTFEVAEIRSNLTKAKLFLGMLDQQSPAEAYKLYANLHMEKQRLQSKYQEMFLQCKLDDLIQHYGVLFDFDLIKQALSNLNTIDPISIEINGQPFGRILIEVRNDVAPKMAKNFGALCTGELGFGYKGCSIFQCWENESIITGDFELNNGRGGRSVFEEGFFMPDDTKILAIRGSVGMRRSQKRHDNMGLVGSQFRIILREMRGFTGIFAFVVEGLELVEKISQAGDSAGKPQSTVLIANCGKWQ
uniref:PPIase cyclophilin-type domain-containing protein n=1 Tax=Anopheles culicifacies TaxID=139723 RepID=A0A182MCN2_9DIPT